MNPSGPFMEVVGLQNFPTHRKVTALLNSIMRKAGQSVEVVFTGGFAVYVLYRIYNYIINHSSG